MNNVETSDALDLTKENIKPLKQGRNPLQLETALQAQTNMDILKQLNKDKNKYEHDIRTYEGDDPLGPRYEYIKWLEQVNLHNGPNSNLLPLIEETIQKFKNDLKYKQDLRFVEILINFIENQPNSVELFQIVFNQGLGSRTAIFYKAWADLLDRCNDYKRVDKIYLLGIQYNAEPREELEQAHLQFQLSIGRRLLNGQLSNEGKNTELDKRNALKILKKSETKSGIRNGSSKSVMLPQENNTNKKKTEIKIFEDNNENGFFDIDDNFQSELPSNKINKENVLNPGKWNNPKNTRLKVPKLPSSVNFKVHQDDNDDGISKLDGIKVPNALRRIKAKSDFDCPIAIFEPMDPKKKLMYCKDKVYAAGRDIQLEEIRYEVYLKQEKEKAEVASKNLSSTSVQKKDMPLKSVVLPEDNMNINDLKVSNSLPVSPVEPDTLSQSITVNTRAARVLVQQMWNSPSSDNSEKEQVTEKDEKPILINEIKRTDNIQTSKKEIITNLVGFSVYTDDDIQNIPSTENSENVQVTKKDEKPILINEIKKTDNIQTSKKEIITNSVGFSVYTDDDIQSSPSTDNSKNVQVTKKDEKPILINEIKKTDNIQTSKKEIITNSVGFSVYTDDDIKNNCSFQALNDKDKIKDDGFNKENRSFLKDNQVNYDENTQFHNKPSYKDNETNEVTDDLTCSTKAFACVLTSSTPLCNFKTKNSFGNPLHILKVVTDSNDDSDELKVGTNLSMILERSKEHTSSLSDISINLGDVNNPFEDKLISKLLQNVIKFPKTNHLSGYNVYKIDLPNIRSEFKLGDSKMLFLGELGKGTFGRVVKVCFDDSEKALKIEKPACLWEWYIYKEIEFRLKDSKKLLYFINMDKMHVFKNGSIISMEFSKYGTLLSTVVAFKNIHNRSIPGNICAIIAKQITLAVKYLHECQIIHADLKPDNIVIKSILTNQNTPCIQLIDFGRSIDMSLFPEGHNFTYSMKITDSICPQMRDNLPWSYQIDYFGLAGIIYLVLMSDFMKVQKIRKMWVLSKPFPRYIDKTLWDNVMKLLLNVEYSKNISNLDEIIGKLDAYLAVQQQVLLKYNFEMFKKVFI